MSLVAMVYYVLMAQCVVLTLLCLPYVRNVVTYLGKFIPVDTIKWYGMYFSNAFEDVVDSLTRLPCDS